jgi:hypothetical protein
MLCLGVFPLKIRCRDDAGGLPRLRLARDVSDSRQMGVSVRSCLGNANPDNRAHQFRLRCAGDHYSKRTGFPAVLKMGSPDAYVQPNEGERYGFFASSPAALIITRWMLREEFYRTLCAPVAPALYLLQPNRRCIRPDHLTIVLGRSASIRP